MVFFTDKEDTPYSVSEPLEFLSQRSLDRRLKNGFGVTEADLPVNPAYVQSLKNAGADVYFTSRWFNAALVQMDESLESTIQNLSAVESILKVAPGESLSYLTQEYDIAENFTNPSTVAGNTDTQNQMLEVDMAHQNGFTGEGLLIAVFDGGFAGVNVLSPFESLHSENRIIGVMDFVENSGNPYQTDLHDVNPNSGQDHGTRVLSAIAGEYQSTFVGTAPDAKFILAVTEQVESENPVEEYNWLLAAEYADSAGVDIINSSLSYGIFWSNQPDYPASSFDGKTNAVSIAANLANERGILVVTSAGNDGPNGKVLSPADCAGALTIGSVTSTGSKSSFSSVGPTFDGRIKPDLAAMGSATVVVNGDGNIVSSNGTSFSSPLMAGFAACVMEAYPDFPIHRIRSILKLAGNQAESPDNLLGYGIPTFTRLTQAANLTLESKSDVMKPLIYPNPFSEVVYVSGLGEQLVSFKLVDLEGKVVSKGSIGNTWNFIQFDVHLENGMYFLVLESSRFSETIKLLKK